jgi:DNA primase catalytic core
MARIPEAEVERLRQEISLVRLIEEAGLALEQRGKDYAARCPFHADETASLIVTPAKNLYHCFGCGAAGGPIDWVMKHRGVSFRHAVELLREGSPTLPAEVVKRSTVRTLPAPVSLDADDRVLLGQVADYYHQTLKETPDALAYLEARGLRHPELILRFKLGFANRTLGLRLPEKNRKSGAEARRRLERIGIMRESGHEHFTGSLVVPIVDDAGNVVELYGRKIRNDLRKGTPLHLYLPGPHAGTWNLDGLAGSGGEVILCEALIDAMTFWCAGYRNVTSAYGVEGLTEDHLAAFARYAVRRVLIAFDRDEAGERGAAKVAERLKAAGIECYRIEFSKGLDANAYALKVTPASKSLGVLIRSAVWLGQGQAPERGPVPVAVPEPASAEPDIVPLAAKEELPPAPSLPAARVPEGPREIPAAVSEAETVMSFGDRRWRIRGLARNLAYDVLKINLLAGCGEAFHVDTLDLYNARARAGFVTQAAIELQVGEAVLKADLGRVLLKLEALQEAAIREAAAPKAPAAVAMDEIERQAALDLLRTPDLPGRILADFAACGIVGESTNKLVGYLAAVSRKLAAPLAVVIQSSSAAGKSSLMDAVLAFMPEEDRTQYSAMTGQSLFYMGETSLKHRILAIAEEAGAARASYALKLLQSEGELTIASTGSDPKTGNLVTQEYRVEGPVMLMMTTTAIDVDEELLNRCLVLTVDEDREQTRAIHRRQREKRTLAGLTRREARQSVLAVHRNAQRLLRPLAVVNPYADQLTFLDGQTRTRRDHEKYLTLIDVIALLHQHQRVVRSVAVEGRTIDYVEVTPADIALANRLAHEVLGRSLDELPPQSRKLLASVQILVRDRAQAEAIQLGEVRFSRAEVRRHAGLSDTQCRLHLDRLTALEYLLVHRGRRGQSYEYELLFDGEIQDGAPHLAGLIEVDTLRSRGMTASSRGREAGLTGSSRGHGGPDAVASRADPSPEKPGTARDSSDPGVAVPQSYPLRLNGHGGSYPQDAAVPSLAASA